MTPSRTTSTPRWRRPVRSNQQCCGHFARSLTHALSSHKQVEEAAARSSRQAKAVLYNPRAGEVWAFDNGKVVQRTTLADPKARLFERAEGSVIRTRLARIEPTARRMPFTH